MKTFLIVGLVATGFQLAAAPQFGNAYDRGFPGLVSTSDQTLGPPSKVYNQSYNSEGETGARQRISLRVHKSRPKAQ